MISCYEYSEQLLLDCIAVDDLYNEYSEYAVSQLRFNDTLTRMCYIVSPTEYAVVKLHICNDVYYEYSE